jgi:isoleucyl-tRNA synthetase
MRKDAGFEVTDHIELAVSGNEKIEEIVKRNVAEICGDVLADAVVYTVDELAKEWDLNGEKAMLSVKVVK